MKNSGFRHEMKYLISSAEKEVLCRNLDTIIHRDSHAKGGQYTVRSLYFDTRDYDSYVDKIAGVEEREKYRIRIYNENDSIIRLECKKKLDSYIKKTSAPLTRQEYEQIMKGDAFFLFHRKEEVCRDFYDKVMLEGEKPVVTVDYERIPFVFPYGDVRITFDMNIRARMETDLFDFEAKPMPVLENDLLVMEVKYTEYLPDIIRDVLQVKDSVYTAYSKYTMCLEKRNQLRNYRSM